MFSLIGLFMMLGGFFYLLRNWYYGSNYYNPIVVVLIGLALFTSNAIYRNRSKKKLTEFNEQPIDQQVKKIEDEVQEIKKWYEKYK